MNNLLYYPNINLPRTDWTIRALLYYDNIASIVPYQYFCEPENFDPFMREVIQNELIRLINPMEVIDNPMIVYDLFVDYLTKNYNKRFKWSIAHRNTLVHQGKLSHLRNENRSVKIHTHKFDFSVFEELVKMGLAKRIDGFWFNVEERTANELMTFLASVVGNAINYIPTTDRIDKPYFSTSYINNQDIELRTRKYKRDLILKHLIPYPKQVELTNLRRFKDKYHDLLEAFTNKVELVVLNPTITLESPLFLQTIEDMKASKEELTARMNESRLGDIVFGTICGTISAGIAFMESPALGAAPGLLSAIYSACRIQRPESITDQTGLKYLAMVDRKLRRKMG